MKLREKLIYFICGSTLSKKYSHSDEVVDLVDGIMPLFKKEMDKVIGKIIGSLSNDEFWSKENNFQAGIFNRYLDKLRKKANL